MAGFEMHGDSLGATGPSALRRDLGFRVASIPGPAADYNGNGIVDAADYVLWRKSDGTQAGYDTWRAHFGETLGEAGAALSVVPEPSTLLLATLAGMGLLWRRRVRSSPQGGARQ